MFKRKALGLLLAALIAPSLTVVLGVLPLISAGHDLLGAALFFIVFAVILGTVGAAIFLGVAFAVAGIGSPSRLRYILAGGASGLAYAMAGPLVHALGGSLVWVAVLGLELSRPVDSLGERLVLGLAAVIAGLVAGAAYAAVVLPGQPWPWPFRGLGQRLSATPARRVALGIAVAVLAVAALLFEIHDFEGERLCDHTDVVRLSFGDGVYYVPVAMQPAIEPLEKTGPDAVEIFERADHPGTPAAAAAHYGRTYCQAKNAPAWRVTGFWFEHLPPALAAPGYPSLPMDVRELQILGSARAHAEHPSLPLKTPWTGETSWFRIAKRGAGLTFLSKAPLVQGRQVWANDSVYSKKGGHINAFSADVDAFATANFYVLFDSADPDASVPSIRAVDHLLTWLKTPR